MSMNSMMQEAVDNVLIFRQDQQDTACLPDSVLNAQSLDKMPDGYALIAAAIMINMLPTTSLPINLEDPRDVRFLGSAYEHTLEIRNSLLHEQNSRTDPLTELPNRRGLEMWTNTHYDPTKNTYGVIAVDLSNFKAINDLFGHETGDAGIKEAAKFFQQYIRTNTKEVIKSDEHRNGLEYKDIIARVGGDEFIIVLNLDGLSSEDAANIIKRVVEQLESTQLTVAAQSSDGIGSFGIRAEGVLSTPQHPLEFQTASSQADLSMNAKRTDQDR
jgi:GGDEF domain-containing protein